MKTISDQAKAEALAACKEARKQRQDSETYMQWVERSTNNQRQGKKQVRCALCWMWCWPEDRCAAFVHEE